MNRHLSLIQKSAPAEVPPHTGASHQRSSSDATHTYTKPQRIEATVTIEDMKVSWPVKDLLDRMDTKLDTLAVEMRSKATSVELMELERRVKTIERWQWRMTGAGALTVLLLSIGLRYLLG